MNNDESMTHYLQEFRFKAQQIDFESTFELPIQEVRDDEVWDWSDSMGVYYFRNDELGIFYVGRALSTKFGNRIWSHLRENDTDWKQELSRQSTTVNLIPVKDEIWYLAAALELFLIERLHPQFNSRLG
jgi:excinuclease UvrABC nuclease subunit